MNLTSEHQDVCNLENVILFEFILNENQWYLCKELYFKYIQRKKIKYSRNIPLLLSYLLYNFGKIRKNCPLTCSLSFFVIIFPEIERTEAIDND